MGGAAQHYQVRLRSPLKRWRFHCKLCCVHAPHHLHTHRQHDSWNTLLSAAVRAGQPKLVAEVEGRMAARGVEGDVTTRNIRLQHLLATRPLERALAYFDGLQREQAAYVQLQLRQQG